MSIQITAGISYFCVGLLISYLWTKKENKLDEEREWKGNTCEEVIAAGKFLAQIVICVAWPIYLFIYLPIKFTIRYFKAVAH